MGPEAKAAFGQIVLGGAGIAGTVGTISLAVGQVEKIKERFTDATGALNFAGKAAGAAGVAFVAYSTVTALLAIKAADARKNVDQLRAAIDKSGESADRVATERLLSMVHASESMGKAMQRAGISTEDLIRGLTGSGDAYAELTKKVNDARTATAANLSTAGLSAESYKASLQHLQSSLNENRQALSTYRSEQEAAQKTALALNKDTRDLGDSHDQLVKRVANASDAVEDLKVAEERGKKAAQDAADANKEAARATKERADAARDAITGVLGQVGADLALNRAMRDVAQAAKEVGNNQAPLAEQYDSLTEKIVAAADASAKQAGLKEGTAEWANFTGQKLRELAGQYAGQFPGIIAYLDEYIEKLRQAAIRAASLGLAPSDSAPGYGPNTRASFQPTSNNGFGGAAAGAPQIVVNASMLVPTPEAGRAIGEAIALAMRTDGAVLPKGSVKL
jgi:hypothetical protein